MSDSTEWSLFLIRLISAFHRNWLLFLVLISKLHFYPESGCFSPGWIKRLEKGAGAYFSLSGLFFCITYSNSNDINISFVYEGRDSKLPRYIYVY